MTNREYIIQQILGLSNYYLYELLVLSRKYTKRQIPFIIMIENQSYDWFSNKYPDKESEHIDKYANEFMNEEFDTSLLNKNDN